MRVPGAAQHNRGRTNLRNLPRHRFVR